MSGELYYQFRAPRHFCWFRPIKADKALYAIPTIQRPRTHGFFAQHIPQGIKLIIRLRQCPIDAAPYGMLPFSNCAVNPLPLGMGIQGALHGVKKLSQKKISHFAPKTSFSRQSLT
jgi:hypothetical protein